MSKRQRRARRQQFTKSNAPRPKPSAIQQGLVDVVVPVYGEFDWFKMCWASLEVAKGTRDIHLYIVDDGNEKPLRMVQWDDFEKPNIRYSFVTNAQNQGFPYSMNRGIERGFGELVLWLNSDVILGKDAIEIMAEEFDDVSVGVVGAKLVFPLDSSDPHRPAGAIQHAGLVIGFDGRPIHVHMGWPANHPRANRHREMQLVTGACLMTRRTLWEQLGGLSELYGRGTYEDMEFCIAARLRGYKVMYQPAAWGYHYAGASADDPNHSFPIQQNLMIWKARCGNYAYWDEWRFW